MSDKVQKSDEQWRKDLSAQEYRILRAKGTEPAFSSPLNLEKRQGIFRCAACGAELFDSTAKYDSGTGWPSFDKPIGEACVLKRPDNSLFMHRVEVLCASCQSHLGHVFADGPQPTGERYCMNGLALKFVPNLEQTDE